MPSSPLRVVLRAPAPVAVRRASAITPIEKQVRRFAGHAQPRVRALTGRNPRLADLALSFPGLLYVLALPHPARNTADAMAAVVAGAPLATAARLAAVPLWLRAAPPETFMQALPPLPDDAATRRQIGNHLPRTPSAWPRWLDLVAETATWGTPDLALWVAREVTRAPKKFPTHGLRLICLWAWMCAAETAPAHTFTDVRWSSKLSYEAALAASRKWLERIVLHLLLGERGVSELWLHPGHHGGYEFVPLRSPADLLAEAAAMQNCVASYGDALAHHRSRLWSIRVQGQRIATLEVSKHSGQPFPVIGDLRAANNHRVPEVVWLAAYQWLYSHDLMAMRIGTIPWGEAPLDGKAWCAFWGPYWRAKRRIPTWLPLLPSQSVLEALT